jgi:hypothetical protein
MDTKKVEFTSDQFRQLMKLVYLGHWISNSHKDEPDKSIDEMEQFIYSKAKEFGCNDLVEFDSNYKKNYPSLDMEEELDLVVQDYDEYVFWEELAWRMAERDFTRKFDHAQILCMTSDEIFREKNTIADKYFEEFNVSGIENLGFVK